MSRKVFINLPVTDVARSTAFYEAIGFAKDARFSGDHAASMVWSDGVTVMLIGHDLYRTLTPKAIVDAHTTSGVLIALALDGKAEVDAITKAAVAAGGREAHDAEDEGYMYSRAFTDPDGHGFGPFWMDAGAATAAHQPGEVA